MKNRSTAQHNANASQNAGCTRCTEHSSLTYTDGRHGHPTEHPKPAWRLAPLTSAKERKEGEGGKERKESRREGKNCPEHRLWGKTFCSLWDGGQNHPPERFVNI